jgi:hypothetical protein
VTAVTPGGRALDVALTEWGSLVREPTAQPHGAARIDNYIRGPLGGAWPSARLPKNPRDTVAYTRNGQFEWCGMFAAFCWGSAGLARGPRHFRLPSTKRLASTQARLGPPLPRVALDDLQPGDVLVVGTGKKPAGDHITLVMHILDGLVYTVEGNARGKLGDGTVGEGVICRTRPLVALPASARCPVSGLTQSMHAMLAYRPEVGG